MRGRWLVFGAATLWGTSATLARFVFHERSVPPLVVVELRLAFAVAILANLSLSWYGARVLFGLFSVQLVYEDIRMPLSVVYVLLTIVLVIRDRRHYPALFRHGLKG